MSLLNVFALKMKRNPEVGRQQRLHKIGEKEGRRKNKRGIWLSNWLGEF